MQNISGNIMVLGGCDWVVSCVFFSCSSSLPFFSFCFLVEGFFLWKYSKREKLVGVGLVVVGLSW